MRFQLHHTEVMILIEFPARPICFYLQLETWRSNTPKEDFTSLYEIWMSQIFNTGAGPVYWLVEVSREYSYIPSLSLCLSGITYCQHVSEKDKRAMLLAFHIQNVTVLFRRHSTKGLCIYKRKPGTDHAPWIHYFIVAVHHYVHYRWSLSLVEQ